MSALFPQESCSARGARRGRHVMSHVLKVMPRDIIIQMSSID